MAGKYDENAQSCKTHYFASTEYYLRTPLISLFGSETELRVGLERVLMLCTGTHDCITYVSRGVAGIARGEGTGTVRYFWYVLAYGSRKGFMTAKWMNESRKRVKPERCSA